LEIIENQEEFIFLLIEIEDIFFIEINWK